MAHTHGSFGHMALPSPAAMTTQGRVIQFTDLAAEIAARSCPIASDGSAAVGSEYRRF
ncbi:hypothetical protein GCM10027273_07110 [Nocardioides pakistanensis]